MNNDVAEITEEQALECCFRFLAVCFYLPQKELFKEQDFFTNLLKYLSSVCPDAVEYAAAMEKGMNDCSEEELQIEYARLFIGPYEMVAPPYGSVYIDEGKRVMGDSTMQVINVYEKEGLAKSDHFKDLPDHIAVELEFLSYLSSQQVQAMEQSNGPSLETYRNGQIEFINKFVRPWIFEFCEKINRGSDKLFYTSLAGCLDTLFLNKQFDRE